MPLQKFQKRQVRRIPRCDGPAFGGTHFWKTAFPRTHPGFMSRLTAKTGNDPIFRHFRIIPAFYRGDAVFLKAESVPDSETG